MDPKKRTSTIQIKIDEHTEKIKIIENRVDGLTKRQVKTEIDVSELKKGLNFMNGNVKILVENDDKIAKGIQKISDKIPSPWYNRIKPWGWVILFILGIGLIGGLLN